MCSRTSLTYWGEKKGQVAQLSLAQKPEPKEMASLSLAKGNRICLTFKTSK